MPGIQVFGSALPKEGVDGGNVGPAMMEELDAFLVGLYGCAPS
jgi:hypothetical protein